MHETGERNRLLECFQAAITAVDGRARVREVLDRHGLAPPVHLVAIGKAAASMTAGAFDHLGGEIVEALVITKQGHVEDIPHPQCPLHCIESAHPLPDATSLQAGEALLGFLQQAPDSGSFLFLLSGGTSSLVEVLTEGLDADGLIRINRWLLGSGLPIHAMNRVRKRLSRIKAGRLAKPLGGRPTLNLMISDVPDNDPRTIGSGLLIPHSDESISLAGIEPPPELAVLLNSPPPLAGLDAFSRIRSELIATSVDTRRAAADRGRELGFAAFEHEGVLQGNALATGEEVARQLIEGPPGLYVWGGETTVRLPPEPGRGGRCQSLALAAAIALNGNDDCLLLAAGTDGSDGPGSDAGALIDGGTVARGELSGLDAADCLRRADAGSFLEASGDLIDTGPTGTNVMDLMLGLKRC